MANKKIPNPKHQITNKSQISISNDQNIRGSSIVSLSKPLAADDYAILAQILADHVFGILNLDHCNLFDIWFLVLVIFLSFIW